LTATKLATGDPPHDPGGPGLALASSISIDQFIGQELNKQLMAAGQAPLPFPVLSVRAMGRDGSGYATLSWTGSKAPFSAESDPRRLFTTLFTGRTTGPDSALVKLQKTRQSVLDYVGKALERQSRRLGTDDRRKIEIHTEAVRNIERQIGGGTVSGTCKPPTVNATIDFKAMANFPQLVEAETDLIAAALSCGLTRVVKWFMTMYTRLLDKLAAVPEGNGTMLDNTVVLFLNSLNSGYGHSVLKLPIIVAAGANMGIRTNRLIELKAEAHNKLLASLANAVGVPMAGWGDPRFTGTLNLA
jgi:hypothetical protein